MKVLVKIGSYAKKEDWIIDDLKAVIEEGINDEVTVLQHKKSERQATQRNMNC